MSTLPFLKLGCGKARTAAPRRELGEVSVQGRVRPRAAVIPCELIRSGELESFKDGGARKITMRSIKSCQIERSSRPYTEPAYSGKSRPAGGGGVEIGVS
jgi:hypothetical protein